MDHQFQQFDETPGSAVEVAPPKFHEVLRLVEHMPGTILDVWDFYPSRADGMWAFIFACEWTVDGMKSFDQLAGAAKRFPGWNYFINRQRRFSEAVAVFGFGEFELASLVRSLRRRFKIKVSSTK